MNIYMEWKMELCKVGLILSELPKEHYNALTLALKDHFVISSYSIEASLREAGFNVSERTIDRHRTSRCKCGNIKGGK